MTPTRLTLLFLTLTVFSSGQMPTGQIRGRITDAAGAVVPGAAVTSTNSATNVTTRAEANGEGNYELHDLIPGNYQLEVQKTGFKHVVRTPIEVRVGDVLGIDVMLQVGDVAETVNVKAESPLLETATAGVDHV